MANWWRIHAALSGACGSGYLVWLTDDDDNDGHYVLAYGTDRGSIHYRVYPGIQADGSVTGSDDFSSSSSNPSSQSRRGVSSGQSGGMVPPLISAPGCSIGSAGSSMVVDLSNAFQGIIVSLIRCVDVHNLQRVM
jgi:hypothetical protein